MYPYVDEWTGYIQAVCSPFVESFDVVQVVGNDENGRERVLKGASNGLELGPWCGLRLPTQESV